MYLHVFLFSFSYLGEGYFDVRDQKDQWIRVAVKKGGMIILPAGMYHRFTLDSDNYIKVLHLFSLAPFQADTESCCLYAH